LTDGPIGLFGHVDIGHQLAFHCARRRNYIGLVIARSSRRAAI
jgi:hypothetical protein